MMRPSTFFFLTRRGVRNLGKHWAMTIACIASLSVCMTLNIFASLAEVNVGSMVAYLGSQNETVVYLDPECDDATAAQVGETLSAMPGVSGVQYVSKQDVLDTYRGYMQDYSSLWDEFETDNPFKANYRVTLSDLTQMERMSVKMQAIPGVVSVTAPVEMTNIFVEIQKAVTKGGRMIVLVLMVVSIITVGSTIRLSVFARRREIEIMKYVGATNRMVTLPFFVEGLTMGLISGILTAAVSLGCGQRCRWSGRHLADAYGPRTGAGGKRAADHRGNKPAQRCYRRRRGQYVLYPQTSECVTERSRVL